jgi:hypothetical protein
MSRRDERPTNADSEGVTHWLIRYAARRAPGCLSSRLEEEWLADLESQFSELSRLRFALGCFFSYVSLRPGTLFLILGLHAALFCGLVTTLSHTHGFATQPDLANQVTDAAPIEITALPGR